MIPFASLLHSLPRLASIRPFLWAMFAQCECPAIVLQSVVEQQRSSGVVNAFVPPTPLLLYSTFVLSRFLLCQPSGRRFFGNFLRRLLGDFHRFLSGNHRLRWRFFWLSLIRCFSGLLFPSGRLFLCIRT